tara:strand:+ start:321 stop:998 length:678 start_codon:yes stop_codon:yes gene_type:complete
MKDRRARRLERIARRKARIARRSQYDVDFIDKNDSFSENQKTTEQINSVADDVQKLSNKEADSIGQTIDKGIKETKKLVSNFFKNDDAPNKKFCEKCDSTNIWVPTEFNIVHDLGDERNEPTQSWLVGCYDCGYYNVLLWDVDDEDFIAMYDGYRSQYRFDDIESGRASEANIKDFYSSGLDRDALYVDEKTDIEKMQITPSEGSGWGGCIFWIIIGVIFFYIFF